MDTKDYITITISILALIVSITSFFVSRKSQTKQMRTTIRDQLASVVQELITTLSENSILQSESMEERDRLFYSKSSTYSHKLSSLARQASALIEVEPGVAFDVELSAVAQALDVAGDSLQAEKYLQAAVGASPNAYYRVINMRMHADFLFRQARHQEGRKMFAAALEIFDNSTDYNKAINGYIYQVWFLSETWNIPAPHGEAEECYRKAKGAFASISDSASTFRANCLHGLETARAGSPLAIPPSIVAPPSGKTVA